MTDKIINGTYKKDNPNEEIGYQKWEVEKTYEVTMIYEIVAKTKEEASPFSGTWIGGFIGDDNGKIFVTISTNGSISGTTNTGAPNQDVITGTVTDNGGLSATVGTVSTGAKFEGQLSDNYGSGTWSNYGNFLSLIRERNTELLNSMDTETNTFPKELLQ